MDATTATHSYFARFNDMDMHVRNCKSSSHCQKTYLDSLRALTQQEQAILRPHLNHIDQVCKQAGYERLVRIPWTFWVTRDSIEHGYPHTHGDSIVLPESFLNRSLNRKDHQVQFRETLLHEKLHVYQRLYPIETHRLIVDGWGFEPIGMTNNKSTPTRQNPDTNEIVYAHHGTPLQATYKTHAHTLEDIDYRHGIAEIPSAQRDHPFEVMACVLAPLILSASLPQQPQTQLQKDRETWIASARAWMGTYL